MALEERLAQAMETALAHLESLAVDAGGPIHQPARRADRDTLPEIPITGRPGSGAGDALSPICCKVNMRRGSGWPLEPAASAAQVKEPNVKPCKTIWLLRSQAPALCAAACSLPL